MQLPWGSVSVYESPAFRAAVVISKKTLPQAHNRNRMRRRLYSALAELETAMKETPQVNTLVVFPRREALSIPHATLSADLRAAIAKTHISR